MTNAFLTATRQFSRTYGRMIGDAAARHGLSRVEADVLLFLRNNPGYDTARDVVEYRCIAKSYVSKAVDSLMRRGFLSVREDGRDRRVAHLAILPAADSAVQDIRTAQQDILAVMLADVSPAERQSLCRVLEKISANLQRLSN